MSRGKFASLLIEPVCIAECRRALLLSAEKSHARPIDDGIRNDKERKQMKNWKTVFSVAMTMLLAFSMVGCAGSSATTQTETADEPAAAETTAETADTDASGETVKPVLLVVSFGTSYNDSDRERAAKSVSRLRGAPRVYQPDHHRQAGGARRT
jgi:hypothetical protein